jgi:hypothetical protein
MRVVAIDLWRTDIQRIDIESMKNDTDLAAAPRGASLGASPRWFWTRHAPSPVRIAHYIASLPEIAADCLALATVSVIPSGCRRRLLRFDRAHFLAADAPYAA